MLRKLKFCYWMRIYMWWIQRLFLCPKLNFLSAISDSLQDRSNFHEKITSKCFRANNASCFLFPVSTNSRKSSGWLKQYLIIKVLSFCVTFCVHHLKHVMCWEFPIIHVNCWTPSLLYYLCGLFIFKFTFPTK